MSGTSRLTSVSQAKWLSVLGGVRLADIANLFTEDEISTGEAYKFVLKDLDLDIEEYGETSFVELMGRARQASQRSIRAMAREDVMNVRLRMEKRKADEVEGRKPEQPKRSAPPLPPVPVRTRFGTRRARGHQDPLLQKGIEDAEREKWLTRLAELLEEVNAPSHVTVSASQHPTSTLKLLSGGRRPATLRARVRAGERFVQWLRSFRGRGTVEEPSDLADYLVELLGRPCGRSVLKSAWSMFRYLEAVGGQPPERCFTEQGLVKKIYEGALATASEPSGRNRGGKAPRILVSLIKEAECRVVDRNEHPYTRMLCWYVCLSTWGILRFDDHKGVDPKSLVVQPMGWMLGISKTKTTGPDKEVKSRPLIISRGAYLLNKDWFSEGWELMKTSSDMAREFLLCEPCVEQICNNAALGYVEYAGRFRSILSQVRDEDGHQLGPDFAMYFTPHSMRPFLISASVALGAPRDGLKWLQGWNAKGGESYIRTCAVETARIQDVVAHAVRRSAAKEDLLGEASELRSLAGYLKERGVHELDIERIIKTLAHFPEDVAGQHSWSEWEESMLAENRRIFGGVYPSQQSENEAPMSTSPMTLRSDPSANADLSQTRGQASREPEKASMEAETGGTNVASGNYVISVSGKKQLRRLHYCGGCHRVPGVDYLDFVNCGATLPSTHEYDDYCHQCWRVGRPPSIGDDSVGTESESSSTASEEEPGAQIVRE